MAVGKRFSELKLKMLRSRLEALIKDYEAIANALITEIDSANRNRLRRQAAVIEEEIIEVEQQLDDSGRETVSESQASERETVSESQANAVDDRENDKKKVQEEALDETPVNLFCSYSGKDIDFLEELTAHLSPLRRQGLISNWYSRNVDIDAEWSDLTSKELEQSRIFLFLVSADFLVSDYAYSEEGRYALQKHADGEARVLPIILRPVDWSDAPFSKLQVLPRGGQPLSTWSDVDAALVDIVKTIRQVVKQEKIIQEPEKTGIPVIQKINIAPEKIYKLHEVFKPSGVPTTTFVEPVDFYLLKMTLLHPGRGLIIEGPSGIGKTTALKKAIRQLQISEDFDSKFKILSARFPEDVKALRNISSWQEGIVAIDDFHLLDRSLGNQLVDRLKYLADQESVNKIIIIGIPHTRTRLVEVGYDVATRIEIISMSKIPDFLVEEMIEKGELALNISFSRKAEIVSVANGSLNIAQMLCAKLAAREDILKTQNNLKILHCYLEEEIEETKKVMDLKYGEFIKTFSLLNGRQNHSCINLLLELSRSEDAYLSLIHSKKTHPHLVSAVEEFVEQDYIGRLEREYSRYSQFIFYDKYASALAIDDPQLIFYLKQNSPSQLMRAIGMSESSTRNKIFISYSHTDGEWLKKLQVYLKPLEKRGLVERWDDTKIKTGMKWRNEIRKALDSAKIAILLVSSNFLASDFIAENELPPLLKAAKNEGAIIFSIILDPCKSAFSLSELEQFQTLNPPSQPLSGMGQHEQGETFDRLLTDILKNLDVN